MRLQNRMMREEIGILRSIVTEDDLILIGETHNKAGGTKAYLEQYGFDYEDLG
jgi:hypothetical protein